MAKPVKVLGVLEACAVLGEGTRGSKVKKTLRQLEIVQFVHLPVGPYVNVKTSYSVLSYKRTFFFRTFGRITWQQSLGRCRGGLFFNSDGGGVLGVIGSDFLVVAVGLIGGARNLN